jgi:hypothetical protein
MTKNEFIEKINEYKVIRDEHMKLLRDNAKNVFGDITKDIFNDNPQLASFSWNQYTPYFNDGETCEFHVNRDYYKINNCDDNVDNWTLNNEKYSKEIDLERLSFDSIDSLKKAFKQINDLLSMFENADLQQMFGDHAEITVNRNGEIEVDEYSHD